MKRHRLQNLLTIVAYALLAAALGCSSGQVRPDPAPAAKTAPAPEPTAAPEPVAEPAPPPPVELLVNGALADVEGGVPRAWVTYDNEQTVTRDAQENALRVDVAKKGGSGYGQILQEVKVKPNTYYRLQGDVKSSRKGLAFLQVKRRSGRKEIDRVSSASSGTAWDRVSVTVSSGSADNLLVLCRFRQAQEHVGATAWFRNLSLVETTDDSLHEPFAVQTFECVGLYWKPKDAAADNPCAVRYRRVGAAAWRDGLDLWFDPNNHKGQRERSGEYRGSVVYLEPGTAYEFELRLGRTGTTRRVTCTTWSDEFEIKETRAVPATFTDTYRVTEGGSERDGYVVYAPAAGTKPVWDARRKADVAVSVSAPYVIVRGLTIQNPVAHGIRLEDVHHVVVEDCDVSGWGRDAPDGYGVNLDGAVFSSSDKLHSIVVQNNGFHHPHSNSNSWKEQRNLKKYKGYHPMGPQGITFAKGKGRYVIRYNRIYSDLQHMFNDGMGEVRNFTFAGFPNRDSDVYGNYVSHALDDCYEIEGANMNVRVWDNCSDVCHMGLAGAATSLGPIYFFRNVMVRSRKGRHQDNWSCRGAGLLKLGGEKPDFCKGRMYVFHNTIYQPPGWREGDRSSGAAAGLVYTSSKKLQSHMVSRNNILHIRDSYHHSIKDVTRGETNDFDYDFINGKIRGPKDMEAHAVVGLPTYDRGPDGRPWLRPGTPGHDAGARIPNFNDDFQGAAPDMGAIETNSTRPLPPTWPERVDVVPPERWKPKPNENPGTRD